MSLTNTTPVPSETAGLDLHAKFHLLEQTLNAEIVERPNEVFGAILALISGKPMFMLGPPGVAKSLFVNRLHAYISGARNFDMLMMRFTQPEEVFGPMSLKGLQADEFRRKIDGYLPMANLAFIDEIFKANSAILNALLWIINEGKYRHDTTVINVPLHTLMCASNEMPQDEGLAALYDRLLLKFVVDPIKDNESFKTMLVNDLLSDPAPILTWDEVEQASKESRSVKLTDEVINALTDIKVKLKTEGIEPTDRTFRSSLTVIKAAAWLDGANTADLEHLRPLCHVLWRQQDEIAKVANVVLPIAAPLDNDAHKILADLEQIEQEMRGEIPADARVRMGDEIHKKLRKTSVELAALTKRLNGRSNRTVERASERAEALTTRVLKEFFMVDTDN